MKKFEQLKFIFSILKCSFAQTSNYEYLVQAPVSWHSLKPNRFLDLLEKVGLPAI